MQYEVQMDISNLQIEFFFAISTFAITEEITLVWIADKNLEIPVEPFFSRYRTLFSYKSGSRPSFLRHTQWSRIQKLGLFWGPRGF